jgi:tetratricopeptide (TPR) repeat protein
MLGRYNDAIPLAQEVLRTQENPQAYSNLGSSLYCLGRYDEAAIAFEHAAHLSSKSALYWVNLGDAYRWSSTPDKAKEIYEKALAVTDSELSVNPQDAFLHSFAATADAKLRRFAEAHRHSEIAMKIDPQNVLCTYVAALVANLEGNHDSAAQLLAAAIARGYNRKQLASDPEFANLRNNATISSLLNSPN